MVEFAPDDHLTLMLRRASSAWRTFGDLAVTYGVVPESSARCRLLVKLVVRYPRGSLGRLDAPGVLPFGDLVMMRKQLVTLKRLAERTATP